MIRIDKVTTKSGDSGETSLGDGSRVRKSDYRIKLLGSLDRTSSLFGLAYQSAEQPEVRSAQKFIISTLFDIGSYIASNGDSELDLKQLIAKITNLSANLNSKLQPLSSFILPTNGEASVRLSLARASAREVEVLFWEYIDEAEDRYSTDLGVLLNRISDLAFVLSRITSEHEELWVPAQRLEN